MTAKILKNTVCRLTTRLSTIQRSVKTAEQMEREITECQSNPKKKDLLTQGEKSNQQSSRKRSVIR